MALSETQSAQSNKLHSGRFLVYPTGRSVLAWGVFDSSENAPPKIAHLPTLSMLRAITDMQSIFISRHRRLEEAKVEAARLNRKAAA